MQDTVVIDVRGSVTVGPDARLRQAIQGALAEGARRIVLDMERVTRLDSSGVGELVAAHTSVARGGGRLVLVGLSPRLATVLQITHLMGVLEIYDDAAAALAALDADAGPGSG